MALLLLTLAVLNPASSGRVVAVQPGDTTVVVDGQRIHAICTGSGRPGVLLLHGAGSRGATWERLLERWDDPMRVCAYDRLGHGQSDPLASGRGWRALIDELQTIHRALGFTRPTLLVGHSLGALYSRALAALAPDHVLGLVLIDPAHEDLPDRVRDAMPSHAWRRLEDSLARNADGIDQRALGAFLRKAPTPRMPLTVITATRRQKGPGWDPDAINAAADELHAQLARESPAGRHVRAEDSGHNVHHDRPDLVLAEIRRLANEIRDGGATGGVPPDSGGVRLNGV